VNERELEPNWPVLVGVGTCFDDVEAVEMMARATIAAGADSGSGEILERVERIVVPRGTWSYADPARIVGRRIGAPTATTVLVDVGIPQQTLIDEVLAAMLAGDLEVAVVTGAEAKARSARLLATSTKGDTAGMAAVFGGGTAEAIATETDQGDIEPDVHQHPVGDLIDPAELSAGLFAPVEQYALIESALAAHEGLSIDEMRTEVAVLWARFNEVAERSPDASFPAPMTADQLRTPSPANRPLALPYNKWLVSQWTVDQGVSLLFTTVGAARRAGIDPSRWIHPLVGLSSSHLVPLSQRAEPHRWPAMGVLGRAAEDRLGAPVGACEVQEVYSCFPVAVRVQQRELGLPLDGTPTITGGMTFGGGPFNSFVLQAMAPVVRRLRESGGRALVTSVSGLLTKPGLGVWAAAGDGEAPFVADLARAAEAATARRNVRADHDGPVTMVAATVTFEGLDPIGLVALAVTPEGEAVIVRSADPSLVERAQHALGVVGEVVRVSQGTVVR